MGVIPTHLMTAERAKQDVTQLVITQDMHERKKVMFMNSDAIVVLPGGAGSLDEFFEVLTWAHPWPACQADLPSGQRRLLATADRADRSRRGRKALPMPPSPRISR